MAETLVEGTKEYLIFDLEDRFDELSDLAPVGGTFDVYNNAGTKVVDGGTLVIPTGMRVRSLIDTTLTGLDASETEPYHVYLRFETLPEEPYLHGGDFFIQPVPL